MIIATEPAPALSGDIYAAVEPWQANEPWQAGEARYYIVAADEEDLDDYEEDDFDDEFDDDFEEELEDEYELSEFEDVTEDDLIEDEDEDLGKLGGDFVDEDAEPEEPPVGEGDEADGPAESEKPAKKKKGGKASEDFGDDE